MLKVCTVIGFPFELTTSAVKAFETKDAIANGATFLKLIWLLTLGTKRWEPDLVFNNDKAVVDAAAGKCVKVIIENLSSYR